jgi:hypothetical protein
MQSANCKVHSARTCRKESSRTVKSLWSDLRIKAHGRDVLDEPAETWHCGNQPFGSVGSVPKQRSYIPQAAQTDTDESEPVSVVIARNALIGSI